MRHPRRLVLGVLALLLAGVAWLAWWAGSPAADASRDGAAPPAASADAARPGTARPPVAGAPWPAAIPAPPAPAPAALFEGRLVSSATGEGIAGGELVFSRAGEATSVRTGAGGAFRFEPLVDGRWTLAVASAPGFLPFAPEWGHSPVQLQARTGSAVRGLVVTLAPALEFLGRVVDHGGAPVAGAEVRLVGAAAPGLVPVQDRLTSGSDGSFRFSAPDGALLEAHHPGYAPGAARVDWTVRATGRLTVRLGEATGEAAGRIAGRVEEPAGAAAAGALVLAWPERRRGGGLTRSATTDDQGRFELSGLPPGRHSLTASRPGLAPGLLRGVEVGTEAVVLRLGEGGVVEGRVRERGGAPVTSFAVAVRGRGREGRASSRSVTVVDPDGRYRVEGLTPGAAWVSVSAPGRRPPEDLEVTVPAPGGAPATADFELAAGARLHGVVQDARSREPVRGAAVAIEGWADPAPSALPSGPAAVSGADGRFELTGLPDGPLSLVVTAEGHHGRVVGGLAAREGAPGGPVTVALTPLADGEDPRLELAGIGAVLAPRRGTLAVVSVVPGGGAAEAGIAPGDEVVRVDGQAVTDLGFAATVDLVRGPEGSTVVLGLRRRGDPQRTEVRVVVQRRLVRD